MTAIAKYADQETLYDQPFIDKSKARGWLRATRDLRNRVQSGLDVAKPTSLVRIESIVGKPCQLGRRRSCRWTNETGDSRPVAPHDPLPQPAGDAAQSHA